MSKRGFTIIEIMVAVLVLAVGILAIAASSALVTRFILQGQLDSEASALAHQQMERMRSLPCDSVLAGSATDGPFALAWTVASNVNGKVREVRMTVTAPTLTDGTAARPFSTTIFCR